ncbi:MAG TPA: 5-formyltetrahydrofolate cyclo-ligase [Stellaceae bacterium]|nr:5-formyltetrahydrofolate cyclo-ligase [Stellaceae bacterium]
MTGLENWSEIAAWRRAQRQALMAARNALAAPEHRAKSRVVEAQLETLLAAHAGALVGIYWPIRREFDPLPLARRLVMGGAEFALPMVVGKGQPLEFRRWAPGVPMATGVYDIPYPADGPAVVPRLLIVPLLGFDAAGYRLGYGAGYYDRTLASYHPRPATIGVGFELGRLATIHPQPHDIAMDEIVTEAGFFRRGL